ncbi:hypothetical protein COCNU_scaffold012296G000020 [Cocos nucifera]|nr:hypothetical protein [Cocos nucifera]
MNRNLILHLHHRKESTLLPHPERSIPPHHRDTRATSMMGTLRHRRRRRRHHHLSRTTIDMMMIPLASHSYKDVWVLFAAVVCWKSAASKEP